MIDVQIDQPINAEGSHSDNYVFLALGTAWYVECQSTPEYADEINAGCATVLSGIEVEDG